MSAKRFICFMLVLMVFAASLFVYGSPANAKDVQNKECPAGAAVCNDEDASTKSADIMLWQSVSRHLLNVIQ
ncbi:MAG: hypothetical protein QM726_00565 [Chitinophagaceae bacterium]